MHPPTSSLAITVGRAIEKCKTLAQLGGLRLFQFRQITEEYPTLLAPLFLMQTQMRIKLLGQDWWASKRQIFKDARDLVQEEEDNVLRAKILEKQAKAAAKAKEERDARRREKKALKRRGGAAGGGGGSKRTDSDSGTDTGTDTGTGTGTGSGSDSEGTSTRTWMQRMGVSTGAITSTPMTDTAGGSGTRTSSAAGGGGGSGGGSGGGTAGTEDHARAAKTMTGGPGAGRTVTVYAGTARTQTRG